MPATKRAASKQPVIDVDGDGDVAIVDTVATTSPKKQGKNFLQQMAAQKEAAAAARRPPMPDGAKGLSLVEYLTEPGWREELQPLFAKPYMAALEAKLSEQLALGKQVFPPMPDVFAAFNECPASKLRVVLIGQDPYHDVGQAHGLCFSVLPGVKTPPSLVNMYKELATDIPGFKAPPHGYLITWAQQGMLMLNATLTVEAHSPNSHEKFGWQQFTDDVIEMLSKKHEGLVFLLWGGFAQKKGKKIDRTRHRVIECAHPSPLSFKKWQGCKTFSQCNAALKDLGKPPIDWALPATPPTPPQRS